MDEQSAAIGWAWALLSADVITDALVPNTDADGSHARTGIYDTQAPQGTLGDYVILQSQSYTEVGTSRDGQIGAGSMLLLVKAVCKTADFTRSAAISAAVHTAIQGQNGIFGTVTIRSCVREQRLRYMEVRDGISYSHLGAMYRLIVSAQ